MALGAYGNQPVFVVANRAVDFSVPTRCFAPGCIRHFVTAAAGSGLGVLCEGNLERGVCRVTLETCGRRLSLKMRLVTVQAGGNGAMPVRMTVGALQLSVSAGVLLQVCRLLFVAFDAKVCQLITGRQLPGAVGVGVTGGAGVKLLSVRKAVAIAALGHQFCPVIFAGIVGMENFVAALAVELVPAARFFEIPILGGVALATLNRGEGWRFEVIRVGRFQPLTLGRW